MVGEPPRPEMRKIMTGNYAAAWGARVSNVEVITAYPITPQTTVMEKLSDFVELEGMQTQYIRMESEHSVFAGAVGASIAGARVFTATSGQGLLYATEMVHWASGTRLPIVVTIASRGIAPPWNIWADFSDVISMRDSGWLTQFSSTHQEILDSVIMGYKVTEDIDVLLPLFIAYGGFVLSHTYRPVTIPDQGAVDKYLPAIPEKGWPHIFMDPERPMMHGNLINPSGPYMEFRMKIHEAMLISKAKITAAAKEFKKVFKRDYGDGLIQEYKCEDADVAIMYYGELAKQAEVAVDELREEGYKVGTLKLRTFRPFPTERVQEIARRIPALGVVDRAMAYGSPTGGPASSEVLTAITQGNLGDKCKVLPFIAGLGGRDVTVQEQKDQMLQVLKFKESGEIPKDSIDSTVWTGLLHGS